MLLPVLHVLAGDRQQALRVRRGEHDDAFSPGAPRSHRRLVLQYGDGIFCTKGNACNCCALRPVLSKTSQAGSCLELNVAGARKESEQIPVRIPLLSC